MQHHDHRQRFPGVASGNVELVGAGSGLIDVGAGDEVSRLTLDFRGKYGVARSAIDGRVGGRRLTKNALNVCSRFEKPTSTRQSSRREESKGQSLVGRHDSFEAGGRTA